MTTNEFQERIKALRKKLKLTKVDMARKFLVDPITITRWERGDSRPSLVHIRKLERMERK